MDDDRFDRCDRNDRGLRCQPCDLVFDARFDFVRVFGPHAYRPGVERHTILCTQYDGREFQHTERGFSDARDAERDSDSVFERDRQVSDVPQRNVRRSVGDHAPIYSHVSDPDAAPTYFSTRFALQSQVLRRDEPRSHSIRRRGSGRCGRDVRYFRIRVGSHRLVFVSYGSVTSILDRFGRGRDHEFLHVRPFADHELFLHKLPDLYCESGVDHDVGTVVGRDSCVQHTELSRMHVRRRDGYSDVLAHDSAHESDSRPDGGPDGRADCRPDCRPDCRTDGRADVRSDGRTDGRSDVRSDGRADDVSDCRSDGGSHDGSDESHVFSHETSHRSHFVPHECAYGVRRKRSRHHVDYSRRVRGERGEGQSCDHLRRLRFRLGTAGAVHRRNGQHGDILHDESREVTLYRLGGPDDDRVLVRRLVEQVLRRPDDDRDVVTALQQLRQLPGVPSRSSVPSRVR